MDTYKRNYLYIEQEQQNRIKNTNILIAGAGLGSVIAETALRLGFENLTIIDGDKVEATNLNRQNYTFSDIGKPKVEALQKRLLLINPKAKIQIHNYFLNESNTDVHLKNCTIAINTIDFDNNASFVFDKKCKENKIPVIHPFNLGWAGCAFVVNDKSTGIAEIQKSNERFELSIVKHTIANLQKNIHDISWLKEIIEKYKTVKTSPPQLSVASNITAGIVTNLLFMIANNLPVKHFPFSYFLSSRL